MLEMACYVSFCGEGCKTGYTSAANMKGEVGSLGPGSACSDGKVQTSAASPEVSWADATGVGGEARAFRATGADASRVTRS